MNLVTGRGVSEGSALLAALSSLGLRSTMMGLLSVGEVAWHIACCTREPTHVRDMLVLVIGVR